MGRVMSNLLSHTVTIFCLFFLGLVFSTSLGEAKFGKKYMANRSFHDLWFNSKLRFGKRDTQKPELVKYQAMMDADDNLSRLGRPRFGKRDTPHWARLRYNTRPRVTQEPELMMHQGMLDADDTLMKLSRPRFGKRDTPEPEPTRYLAMMDADDTLLRLRNLSTL